MIGSPLVTIGLPVYNSEKYVEQSLDSLLGQTYSDFVLIINDNASTDNTSEICRKYAENDSRIRFNQNDKNIGNPSNFNQIFELTETKYLKWSTADDYWAPTFLARAVEVMEADSRIILCYPKTFVVDAEGRNQEPYEDELHLIQDDPVDRYLALMQTIGLSHQHLGLMRTDEVRKTHLLRTHVASDINLLAEMTLFGKFYELPDRLFYRRFHQKSGSWKRGDLEHESKHYHAANSRTAGFKEWHCILGFFAGVNTSPLPFRSKLRIYRFLARRARWSRNDLISELIHYIRFRFRRQSKMAFRQ